MFLKFNFIYQFLATFSALIALFMIGIHEAWSSVYIPRLLDGDPFRITSDEGSWIAASLSIGAVIGAALSPLAHKFGRKPIILMTSIPYLVSSLLLILANSVLLLCVARIIVGIASGVAISVTPLYLGEIAHEKIRGALGMCVYIFIIMGFLFINCIGSYLENTVTCGILIGLVVTFIVTFVLMPESPYFLIMKNKDYSARKSLEKFLGNRDIDKDFSRIQKAVVAQSENRGFITEMFRVKSNRRALLILFIILNGKQLSADMPIDVYGFTIFQKVCGEVSPSIVAAIYYISKLVIVISSSFFVDKVGRKKMLVVSFFLSALCSLLLGVHFYIKDKTTIVYPPLYDYLALAVLTTFGIVFCALTTIPSIILSELFPMNVKKYISVFYGMYFFLGLWAMIQFYEFTSVRFGTDVPFFAFAASSFIHGILVWIFVFETAGKTLEEIQEHLCKL